MILFSWNPRSKLIIILNRPYGRDEVLNLIKDEFEQVKDACDHHVHQLEAETRDYLAKIEDQSRMINQLNKQIKHRTIPTEEKGVQFTIRDVLEPVDYDDSQRYFTSLTSFIIGGQTKGKEWTIPLITDILSSKLWADYQDLKEKRKVSSLRVYLMQYFIKQFGCRSMGIVLLKDFLSSLAAGFKEDHRIDLFMDLAGIAELKLHDNMDVKSFMEINKVSF